MGTIHMTRRRLLLASAGACLADGAFAQTMPPTGKTVKLLVGFPPGQATDIVARILAEKLAAATGDTFIVENRPGQGGSLAMVTLARSPNDGSVMMLANLSAMATNPHTFKNVFYDPIKDFAAIGLVGDLPFVLVANPSVPVRNVAELIAYAKANPGKLTHASSGTGTVSHLAMEEFKRHAGVDILHVPYQGSARGLTDVMAGNVALALETAASTKPLIEAGRLRILGAGSAHRLDGVLNVPTLMEQGIPDFTAVVWLMLIVPAGVPKGVVDANFAALQRIAQTSDYTDGLKAIGIVPRSSQSPIEADAFVRSEHQHWGEVVKRSGITL